MSVSMFASFDHLTPTHQHQHQHHTSHAYLHKTSYRQPRPVSMHNVLDKVKRVKRSLSRKNSNPQQQGNAASSKDFQQSAFLAPQSNSNRELTEPLSRTQRTSGHSNMNATPTEPPPAYTLVRSSQAIQPISTPLASADDPYTFLKSFDTIFLIDDSGSMADSYWSQVSEALKLITPICAEHDADGIDIYFLNQADSPVYKNITHASTVVEIFQTVRPYGGTPTGQKLHQILKPYLQKYAARPESTKPVNIIVITDGAPTDDVESPIIAAAKKLDRLEAPAWQVGIQFFQVGREEAARKHLKQLDDELREISGDPELRDMVDTVEYKGHDNLTLSAAGVLKVVLGSVNRRLDRNSKELHRH